MTTETIEKSKKISLILALAILLGATTPLQCTLSSKITNVALKIMPKKKHLMLSTAIATVATMFVFYSRTPGKYELKFKKDELKQAFKDKDFKKIVIQTYNFFSDLLGCKGSSSTIKVVKNGDKIDLLVNEGAAPVGLGGYIDSKLRNVMKALSFIIAVRKFGEDLNVGLDEWKDFVGY